MSKITDFIIEEESKGNLVYDTHICEYIRPKDYKAQDKLVNSNINRGIPSSLVVK
jgi:hypothetical protein